MKNVRLSIHFSKIFLKIRIVAPFFAFPRILCNAKSMDLLILCEFASKCFARRAAEGVKGRPLPDWQGAANCVVK